MFLFHVYSLCNCNVSRFIIIIIIIMGTLQKKCAIIGSLERVELLRLHKFPNYPCYGRKPRGNIQLREYASLVRLVLRITF